MGKKSVYSDVETVNHIPTHFAVGLIYDELSENGCNFIGSFEPKDYTVTDSLICKNGKFVGLAIDDCNESSQKVSERIHEWCNLIKKEIE